MTKKTLALLLAACLMVLAVGCGKHVDERNAEKKEAASNTTSSSGTNSNTNSTTQTTEEPVKTFFAPPVEEKKPEWVRVDKTGLKLGDAVKAGPLALTVLEKAAVTKAAGLPPGYVYLVMHISIKNEGKEDYTINTADHFKLETPEAKTMPYNVQATAQKSPKLQGTLQQGQSADGWLGYLVKGQPGTFKYHFIHPDYGEAVYEFAIQ